MSTMAAIADVSKLDLYEILDISIEATDKEIVKAYRKKALKCHPDKNPDNPKAAELFHQLSQALEVLSDEAARAAYDKILKARHAAKVRHRELDAKRKKFKEDLEARENAGFQQKSAEESVKRNLQQEIERLRKEGSRLLQQEQELLKSQLKDQKTNETVRGEKQEGAPPRLKLKWKSKKGDDINGGYTEDYLQKAFNKYGEVTALIVSSKKNGSAIVEFSNVHSAILAVQNEIGIPSNPLTISWLSGEPAANQGRDCHTHDTNSSQPTSSARTGSTMSSNERDFESIVLMRMRQAEERKRLAEQILKEDEDQT